MDFLTEPQFRSKVSQGHAGRFNGSYFITEVPTTTTFRYIIKDPNQLLLLTTQLLLVLQYELRLTTLTQRHHTYSTYLYVQRGVHVVCMLMVVSQLVSNLWLLLSLLEYHCRKMTMRSSNGMVQRTYKVIIQMATVYTDRVHRNFHVKCSNDAVIQAVSVFAVGFADHFVALSGGDQSITNSNSNFGCSLRAKGFKTLPFTQDKAGKVTHIIPPKKLARTYRSSSRIYIYC